MSLRATTQHLRALYEAAIAPDILAHQHYLVKENVGAQTRLLLVKLATDPKYGPIAVLVARIWLNLQQPCDAYFPAEVAAKKGYGPLIYDAAMEYAFPRGLMADPGQTTKAAQKVWEFYFAHRRDVEKLPKPAGCPLKGIEALDHLYRKSPGRLAAALVTTQEFNAKAAVQDHFGKDPGFQHLGTEAWDQTPHVPGSWD